MLGFVAISCEGPAGSAGPAGSEGPQGPVGPAGKDGASMLAGEGTPEGSVGNTGDFYLDLTTGDLYGPKTESGWDGSLINLAGSSGEGGAEGPRGPKGEDGDDGEDGKDGSQIFSGNSSPDNSIGNPGDFYLDKSTYELYGPKTESGWGASMNLQGPAGEDGSVDIVHTGWFKFEDTTTRTGFVYENRKNFAQYDKDFIQDGGIVLVFRGYVTRDPDGTPEPNDVQPLPITNFHRDAMWEEFFLMNGTYGSNSRLSVDLVIDANTGMYTHGSASGRDDFFERFYGDKIYYYRIFLIPDGTHQMKAPPDAFYEDYSRVKEYFNIPD